MEQLIKLIDPANVPLAVLLALCAGQYKMIVDLMKSRDKDREAMGETLSKLTNALNGVTAVVQRIETIALIRDKQ